MHEIEKDGIDSLVIVPLYPHYSLSTSGSSMKLLYKYFKRFRFFRLCADDHAESLY